MNSERAAQISKQLLESGYADWLALQVRNLAQAKFAAATPDDTDALTRARIVYDLAAEVRQIVFSCARDSKNS